MTKEERAKQDLMTYWIDKQCEGEITEDELESRLDELESMDYSDYIYLAECLGIRKYV